MSSTYSITFFTLLLLGPIPCWHLLLHAFLPTWRRAPRAYYALSGALWLLFIPLSWQAAENTPLLFDPSDGVTAAGIGASSAAFLIALWSMATLTPQRFFVWAVLQPELSPPERIRRGPYRFMAHPTYFATVVAAASNFLASGAAVLLGAAVAIAALLAVVAVLEQRELEARLKTSPQE